MLVWFAWNWRGRHFASDPARLVQFSYHTLLRGYHRWTASGRNPDALTLRYKAPIKLRPGQVLTFARACLGENVRTVIEAHGRLPHPRASFYAYRLRLPAGLNRRLVKLFAARRLVVFREREARAAVNRLAMGR